MEESKDKKREYAAYKEYTYKNVMPPPIPTAPISIANPIGRNEPCPCGSKKKHKRCCMGKKLT